MVFDDTFLCTSIGKYYQVKGISSCNRVNMVYLITCQCCKLQYDGLAINIKERFQIDKSDI